jgi:quercetin dioxygenase-like cupin family protein
LSPTQTVPWHSHNHISDTFYVLEGRLRLYLQNPKQEVQLGVGESYTVQLVARIWLRMLATPR